MLAHVWRTAMGREPKKTGFVLVRDTGIEPVTPSVSGKEGVQVTDKGDTLASVLSSSSPQRTPPERRLVAHGWRTTRGVLPELPPQDHAQLPATTHSR